MITKFLTKVVRLATDPAMIIEAAPVLLIAGAALLVYELVTDNSTPAAK